MDRARTPHNKVMEPEISLGRLVNRSCTTTFYAKKMEAGKRKKKMFVKTGIWRQNVHCGAYNKFS